MDKNRYVNIISPRVAVLAIAASVLLLVFAFFNDCFAQSTCVSGNCVPVLSIFVASNRPTAAPGEEIIYTITYKNTGDAPATGIVIKNPFTDTDQNYLDFVSANPAPDSGNNTWIIDEPLNYNESGQIILTVRVQSALRSNRVVVRDRASIDSNETDPRYSNYASISIQSTCSLSINQSARNITKNSLSAQSVNADAGDEIEFSLQIQITGTNQATNTQVWDTLSKNLEYISGSATIDGSSLGTELVGNKAFIGNLLAGAMKTVKFRAKVSSTSNLSGTGISLRSSGYVSADICGTKSSIATVVIAKKTTSLAVLSSAGLTVTKSVRNVTKKSSGWANTVYVNPGDEIEFSIKIKITGGDDISVRVEDHLPPKMYYISDSTTVDGNYEPDGITTKNIYLAHVYKSLVREIRFKARIAKESEFSLYPISLVNEASAWGSEGKEISDNAKIIVNQPVKSSVNNVGIYPSQGTAQPSTQVPVSVDKSDTGDVKGAATVKTGSGYFRFLFILIISVILAVILYCRVREEKLLEILNDGGRNGFLKSMIRIYFRVILFFKIRMLKFKKA